jgi:glycosyltransferase involved in cell wall biosynthesis
MLLALGLHCAAMASSLDVICEVRVPTYRRLGLLERALRSLQTQTHVNWRCIVFDDCAEGSAEPLVKALGDARITYCQNSTRRGAIGNIDQAFRNSPFVEGEYACVLEDDNYLFPQFLEQRLNDCFQQKVDVTFSAQICETVIAPGEAGVLNPGRTLAWIYPQGILHPDDIMPAVMFSHAFSNGGAFWRLGSASNFELGPVTKIPGIQETARIFRLKDRTYVSHAADATWRCNDPSDSFVNTAARHGVLSRKRQRWCQLLEFRELVWLRSECLRRCGLDAVLRLANASAEDRRREIEDACLICGRYVVLTNRPISWRIKRLIRGWIFRHIVPNGFSWARARRG